MKTTNLDILNPKKDENGNVIEFTISRRFWGRGNDSSCELLDHNGKMCCLGHYGRACGLSLKSMLHESYPSGLDRVPKQMRWLSEERPQANKWENFENALAGANDDVGIGVNNKLREERIQKLFAKRGIKVNFID